MKRSTLAPVLALAIAVAGCKSTPAELLVEADQFAQTRQFDAAIERYRLAAAHSEVGATQREKAWVGEGDVMLAKGDFVGAANAFKRLPDGSSDKWARLGAVAEKQGDLIAAETNYRKAVEKGASGEAPAAYALLLSREASSPERLDEASAALDRAGQRDRAEALREAARVWRARDRAEEPGGLLSRLEKARESLKGLASIELLRAELLERSGDQARADEAYKGLAALEPKPSADFLARATSQRARTAVAARDVSGLERTLEKAGVDERAAAEARADLARAVEAAGDRLSALALWRKVAGSTGALQTLALCEVGRLELERGRNEAARDAWERAAKADPEKSPPAARALIAAFGLREGDPVGTRARLEAASGVAELSPAERARASRDARAAELLERAIAALARDPFDARNELAGLARGALALVPESALAAAFESLPPAVAGDAKSVVLRDAVLGRAKATGATRDKLDSARVSALARAGALDEASGVAKSSGQAALAALRARAPESLRVLARRDGPAAAVASLEKNRDVLGPEVLLRVRADALFASLWVQPAFAKAAGGPPDPLARPAPYQCVVVTASGVSLGPCRVTAVDAEGLSVELAGGEKRRLAASALGPGSLRSDEEADRAE